jgi:DnaJ-class molecular chaperone
MTYRNILRRISPVVATGCAYCGGAKKIGADNRTCPVCNGTGQSATGR